MADFAKLTLPHPDVAPWSWTDEVTIDGDLYPCNWMHAPEQLQDWASRSAIIKGLPECYVDDLLGAAQQTDECFAWSVEDRVFEDDEIDADVLARARQLYDADTKTYNFEYVTFIAEHKDGHIELLACAGARRTIAKGFDSNAWLLVGRLLGLKKYRGFGTSRHFAMPFWGATQTMCGRPAVGCFFTAEVAQTKKLANRAVRAGLLDLNQAATQKARIFGKDYVLDNAFAFYLGMRKWLSERTRGARKRLGAAGPLDVLLDLTETAWEEGYDDDRCHRMRDALIVLEPKLLEAIDREPEIGFYLDFLYCVRELSTEWVEGEDG